jgi:hypothetical protein
MITREEYMPLGWDNQALGVHVSYIDDKLTREECWHSIASSDSPDNRLLRRSRDNGKTWGYPIPVEGERCIQHPDGGITVNIWQHYDPASKSPAEIIMRRQWPGLPVYTFSHDPGGHPLLDHCFIRYGKEETYLKFEDGADYDPENPFDPAYLRANCSYYGQPELLPDGRGFLPLVAYSEICQETLKYNRNHGGLILMRRESLDSPWQASNIINIDPQRSSRGLQEPQAVMLKNGNIMIVCRGSNVRLDPQEVPGYKWMTYSTDGGQTINEIEPFKYDDGSPFYSPSSIHYFIRSSKNGKLYWLANISDKPTNGNWPRYPLYICEIDEEKMAVKKDSLVLVDTRHEGEPETVQHSNFSVLEDRESLNIEIYLTRIGEKENDTWNAKTYRYIFTP